MREQIRSFILSSFLFTADGAKLGDGDSLLELGLIDSTGVLELVAFLESEFSVKVDDEDLIPENLDSVDRIVAFMERKHSAQNGPAVLV